LKSIPRFAKILMLVQTFIILFLSFWIYQEYLNNPYLQSYVNSNLQGLFSTAIILTSIGLFTILAIILYAKLRSYRRELDRIVSK